MELFLSDQNFTKIDVNKDHGRIEIRKYFATSDIEWLKKRYPKWEKLTSVGMVESTRIIREKESVERRYYISSLEANVDVFSHAVRAHWGIENKLHWVLDVIFKEDISRIRIKNSAESFSTVKKIALNLLRKETSKIKHKRKKIKSWMVRPTCRKNTYVKLIFTRSP